LKNGSGFEPLTVSNLDVLKSVRLEDLLGLAGPAAFEAADDDGLVLVGFREAVFAGETVVLHAKSGLQFRNWDDIKKNVTLGA
jgi:hypothetical protein